MSDSVPFRLIIEGTLHPIALANIVEQARGLTPVDGGLTIRVGTHTNHLNRTEEER